MEKRNRGFPDIKNKIFTRLFFIGVILIFKLSLLFAQTPFTSQDALNVKSLRIQGVTEDGRYVACFISTRKGRLNVNHKRFGDPTYISPRLGEILVIDTETGESHDLFNRDVQAHAMTWSPDCKVLAFFLLKGDDYSLQTYDCNRKKIREVKLKTDKKISSNSFLRWTPDGKGLLLGLREKEWAEKSHKMFLEATEGPIIVYDSKKPLLKWEEIRNMSSLQVVALVDLKSRNVTELLPEGRYSNIRQSKDGSFLSYIQYFSIKTDYKRKGGTEYELLKLDLKTRGESKVLIEREEKRLNLSWNEENTKFAWADSGYILMQTISEEKPINLTKGKIELEEGDTTKVKFSMERWSPYGGKLLVRSKKGYWLIDHQRGDIDLVYPFPEDEDKAPNIRVSNWSPDGRFLYMTYSAKDKWERGLIRFDLEERQSEDLVKDEGLYSSWQMSKDGSKFVYTYSDGNLPSELYAADQNFESKIRLTDLNPRIMDKKITKTELVKYLDTDGNELNGILYYPVDYEAGKKYPLVCEIYETFFNNGFHTNMNIIANAGFFGFRPSVKLNKGYPGEAWIKGITSGINKLIERGLVDPKKLGVHGTSYGGYATSLLITQTDRFAAAINISGKTNIISFLGDSPRIGTRNYAAAEVGQDRIDATLWEQPMKYINHSAVMFADRVKTPHLLLTGQDDWNVPMASTREMYYALRRLGKECVWVDYVNAGHGAGRAGNEAEFHDMWKRIIDWYETHFEKGDEKEKE